MEMTTTNDKLVRENKNRFVCQKQARKTVCPQAQDGQGHKPARMPHQLAGTPVIARVQQRRHCARDRVGRTPLHSRRIVPHTLDALPRVLGAARLLLGDRRVVVAGHGAQVGQQTRHDGETQGTLRRGKVPGLWFGVAIRTAMKHCEWQQVSWQSKYRLAQTRNSVLQMNITHRT
jgi:hypothetical protein